MKNVPIRIFRIGKTVIDRQAVQAWLNHLEAHNYVIPDDEVVSDPALLIALAAKRCYMSFEPGLNPNVTKVRSDIVAYLDNILASGHGSVLEHSTYNFGIEGVSRVFTAEMNRHRAGVGISEGSMRYIRFDDMKYWAPPSITLTEEETALLAQVAENAGQIPDGMEKAVNLSLKKKRSKEIVDRAFLDSEKRYAELLEVWKDELAPESLFKSKKEITSMMRRIVPMGIATGGVWSMNFRALRHIIALRASEHAEEEICYVFSLIAKFMIENEPLLFADFTQTPEGYYVPKYRKV